MPKRTSKSGSDLFIVDNCDTDWKVLRYLHDWCQLSQAIDIASGYFEIGALLGLKDEWPKVDRIRILMGDEVTKRTKATLTEGLARRLDASLEAEKQRNDFLAGVPAIVEAIRAGKIVCRVYRKAKFHAKAYITHARLEVVGSSALVGSSNFTLPGLTENIELNVQITGRPVSVLQEWYDEHWDDAEDYYQGTDTTIDPFAENRQKQVVGLIRTQFLKRFESSAQAFECSCERLLRKLLAFATKHSETQAEKNRLERWKLQHKDLIGYVHERQLELFGDDEEEPDEDIVTEEMLEDVADLPREDYKIDEMLLETFLDLDEIAKFLDELRQFKPKHDDKLKALVKLLKSDPVLKSHKVLIFTEFSDTARYLKKQLLAEGIVGVEQIDSGTKRDRAEVISCFAPYYNGSSSAELAALGLVETRVLISTDVLSEGLNLQDATRLINYDLHWNPVRLMQRIGRVDRRLNPEVESRLLADHPEQQPLRGKVAYWNFLPPEELDRLLRLYGKVTHKTLRISKTFGIEGQKLLSPEDDFEALKNFNHQYEGETTQAEQIQLEYQQLLREHPGLADRLNALPGRVFSGKCHPTPGTRAVFFCFGLPAADHSTPPAEGGALPWTEEAGRAAWYLYDLESGQILDDPITMIDLVRCEPTAPRQCILTQETLKEIRVKVEKHIDRTYLKSLQAPQGVKPVLKSWLELSG